MKQKIKTTGKKINQIVIVVIAIVVLGGLYYGAKRWRQQQYVNQLAKLYGGDAGLISNLTGGKNGLTDQMIKDIAKEAAKEEAKQKEEDAKEAAKTPKDKFNDTKEVTLLGNSSSIVKTIIESPLKAVFGSIKPTSFSGNYMGQGDSFLVVYKVPKVVTSDDINKLLGELTKNGYTTSMNSIEAEAAQILVEKDGNGLSIGYDDPTDQEIIILYVDESANN
ncbi:MAG: hypothetical protein WC895_02835 [Candidatus Shapirobacteria bacterium]|jgi:hypothetical protein